MKTTVQKAALVIGILFVALGVLGFLFGSKSLISEPLFGMFHVNLILNVVHLGFGVWGIVAAFREKLSESFSQIAGVIYLILALLGFFTATGFGRVPIGGHNIWLHAIFGLVLLYFGFADSLPEDDGVIVA